MLYIILRTSSVDVSLIKGFSGTWRFYFRCSSKRIILVTRFIELVLNREIQSLMVYSSGGLGSDYPSTEL